MTSREIRSAFLAYFAERGHRVVPSSPLLLPKDPTLLFANAGMNQFKDVFTGRAERDFSRAVSSQKCLRVSGKHNDLEMVGRTPRHHTFFEMLGNFSFGDYFKEQAITFAWQLLTQDFGIPAERLWVTVFGGTDSLAADEEAAVLWRERVGVAAERILRLGEKDNFWRMGETGPCGPCSEIHYDFGAQLASVPASSSTPVTDERRFMEVWNLVFMQFEQRASGELVALPAPCVDTGMGLERISSVLQGKHSNFDTDLFAPILEAAAARAGLRYGAGEPTDFSLRVIADHARALCFLVADGVFPANDRRGYVLRRLLRRAIRHGRKLGIEGPFLHEVTPRVLESLGEVYPELLAAREAILEVGRLEEQRFAETVAVGLARLEEIVSEFRGPAGRRPVLPGKELFRLHDTFGFPLDLARDVAEERGIDLDEAGFEAEMERQRARARASWKGSKAETTGQGGTRIPTTFVGYEELDVSGARIGSLHEEGGNLILHLDKTPFYATAGGQVGDTGVIAGRDFRARVVSTYKSESGSVCHEVQVEGGALEVGDEVRATVDASRRGAIRRNHTATHLLHAALREVLGTHVKQAGSLVAPDRLRFDFSHFSAVSDEALADVESLVHRRVLENIEVETREMDLQEALESGAMALFGEKYGAQVRVVRIGEFSVELCGGTHCRRSGEIGLVKLVQERGIASGTRRIEAVSGEGALLRFREDQAILRQIEERLTVPREKLLCEIDRRREQAKAAEKQLEGSRTQAVRERLWQKAQDPQVIAGIRVVVERVDGLGPAELRELADGLRQKLRSGVVVLGRAFDGKASLLVSVTDDLTERLSAGELVRQLAGIIGGGGGGRRDLAEAGGKDGSRLDEALLMVPKAVEDRMANER